MLININKTDVDRNKSSKNSVVFKLVIHAETLHSVHEFKVAKKLQILSACIKKTIIDF